MKYLEKDAANTYLLLTDVGYDNFLVSDEDYFERLRVLRVLVDPKHVEQLANVDIRLTELAFWEGLEPQGKYRYQDSASEGNEEAGSTQQDDNLQGNDFDPQLHFITKAAGKVSKWEFHKTDSDFFPSIPHGHAIINYKIKLDSYRGYIFKDNKLHQRETRQFTIDLWNDPDFRDTARQTILFYMQTYPLFTWRVDNPLHLPRRRRH